MEGIEGTGVRRSRLVWLFAVLGVAAAALGGWYYFAGDQSTPERMLARLPASGSTLLSVDFDALRRAGILKLLAGAVVDEEPEYKAFVSQTGFDYARDLDKAYLAFHPSGKFLMLRGRFDWRKIEAYVAGQGGSCFNNLCRVMGSTPDRKISFFRLQRNVMAMAVSPDDFAAARLNQRAAKPPISPPAQPVHLFLPPEQLRNTGAFPSGTQLFAKAVEDAENVSLSLGGDGQTFHLDVDVACQSQQQAAAITTAFEKITSVLKELISKEKASPGPADLSSILMAGTFRREDKRVVGRWPVSRAFMETLASAP